jgi:UPF0716 protein FxsA
MFGRLLLLLTVIPFVEFYFLIRMSDNIGFGNTVLVVLFTGVLGAWLLRQQGHSILMDLQKQGSQGQLPSDAIAKGFFTFIGGVLLLTPGILTDALGLSLIFPLTQMLWKKFFMGSWERAVKNGHIHVYTTGNFRTPPRQNQDPFRQETPFNLYEQQRRQMDPNVIDIKATSSKTVKKDESE